MQLQTTPSTQPKKPEWKINGTRFSMPGRIALNATLPFGRNFIHDIMMKTAISLNRGERAFMQWRLLFIWFLPKLDSTSQNKTRMSLFTIPCYSRAAEPFRNWCFFCLWRARTMTDRISHKKERLVSYKTLNTAARLDEARGRWSSIVLTTATQHSDKWSIRSAEFQ